MNALVVTDIRKEASSARIENVMTRQSGHSAGILLRSADGAQEGPRLSVAEPVAGWALPHHGTFVRPLSRHQMTSARSACVGFGTWAASASSGVALGQADRAM